MTKLTRKKNKDSINIPSTTGHKWDGNIEEIQYPRSKMVVNCLDYNDHLVIWLLSFFPTLQMKILKNLINGHQDRNSKNN